MVELKVSAKDLLALIETCAKNQVRSLKLSDLELTFGPAAMETTLVQPHIESPAVLEKTQEVERESLEEIQRQMNKDALEVMKLEDPAEYERLVTSGELVDEPDETSDTN